MGPIEQNQHFTELRQQVSIYMQNLVLLRGFPCLEGNHKLFATRKRKNGQPGLGQTDYNINNQVVDSGLEIKTLSREPN